MPNQPETTSKIRWPLVLSIVFLFLLIGGLAAFAFINNYIPSTTPTQGVVIGYRWELRQGDPKFSSVILPAWGIFEKDFETREYDIYILQGDNFVFYKKARAVVDEIRFPEGGVSKFKVPGIDPKLGICQTDHDETWGIKFAEAGTFHGVRIAITSDAPNAICTDKYQTALKQVM